MKLSDKNAKSIFKRRTTCKKLKTIIENMKDKSGGVDEINIKVLKAIAEFVCFVNSHY